MGSNCSFGEGEGHTPLSLRAPCRHVPVVAWPLVTHCMRLPSTHPLHVTLSRWDKRRVFLEHVPPMLVPQPFSGYLMETSRDLSEQWLCALWNGDPHLLFCRPVDGCRGCVLWDTFLQDLIWRSRRVPILDRSCRKPVKNLCLATEFCHLKILLTLPGLHFPTNLITPWGLVLPPAYEQRLHSFRSRSPFCGNTEETQSEPEGSGRIHGYVQDLGHAGRRPQLSGLPRKGNPNHKSTGLRHRR